MKKHGKWIIKGVLLLCLIAACLHAINRVLVLKDFDIGSDGNSTKVLGFYEMERDSVDVLILGSSHATAAFSPQELYDRFGIRSYNLGFASQSVLTSYYWLREALRTQSPRAVVLDCYCLYDFGDNPLNIVEGNLRKELDYMRWSPVKTEAVRAICTYDESQSQMSYYFPNIRYHTRWTALNEDDFTFFEMRGRSELMGFTPNTDRCGDRAWVPFAVDDAAGAADMAPLMEEALQKMAALCKQRGIALILVKTPCHAETAEKYNANAAFARLNGLDYYDFNEQTLCEAIDFDYPMDMHNSHIDGIRNAHANLDGARKMTGFLGSVLQKQYGLGGVRDAQYESTRAFYEDVWKDFLLRYETDMRAYLPMLADARYTVFLATRGDAGTGLDKRLQSELARLGVRVDLREAQGCGCYAVISDAGVVETLGDGKLERRGTIRHGRVAYGIASAGRDAGDFCSIHIDGVEQAKNLPGLNIVVYDNVTRRVVDSVCFDTTKEACTAMR